MLQTLLQSYQNVSNSQHRTYPHFYFFSCKRFCKVIKMLAIHNSYLYHSLYLLVANAFAKLSKCQQFTTLQDICFMNTKLQTLLQSYQNVSNSQLHAHYFFSALGCKRFCKVIKMLAIHNLQVKCRKKHSVANAFAKLSKCQQFTTFFTYLSILLQLQTLLQSYQNVSNSQRQPLGLSNCQGCKRFCKVIKMLAIHN